jgi:hypothetical protein
MDSQRKECRILELSPPGDDLQPRKESPRPRDNPKFQLGPHDLANGIKYMSSASKQQRPLHRVQLHTFQPVESDGRVSSSRIQRMVILRGAVSHFALEFGHFHEILVRTTP